MTSRFQKEPIKNLRNKTLIPEIEQKISTNRMNSRLSTLEEFVK